MSKLCLMLLTILISGCAGFAPKLPRVQVERCVTVLATPEIPNGICACHDYVISHEKIGPITKAVAKPLNYCDRFVGFHPKTGWIPFLEAVEEAYKTVEDNNPNFTRPVTETPAQMMELVDGL
jgi:hypothetical protein